MQNLWWRVDETEGKNWTGKLIIAEILFQTWSQYDLLGIYTNFQICEMRKINRKIIHTQGNHTTQETT